MKSRLYFLHMLSAGAALLLICEPCAAAPVEAGDTRQEVRDLLGPPQGTVQASGIDVWIYPQGEIEFEGEGVAQIKWMNEQTYRAKQEHLRMQTLQRKQAEEATARALREEARIQREAILADPEYARKTAAEQIAVWDEYFRKFPDEEGVDAHTQAQADLEEEMQAARTHAETRTESAEKQDPPRLSGSKGRKARRAAGQGQPEDRPAFMTRQTLNIKAKEDKPSFLSGQTVRTPKIKKSASHAEGTSLRIKSSSKNPSFLSDQSL